MSGRGRRKSQVRSIQVPAVVLPTNENISVSPQQQGVDISQLISGQQLHLLASHLQDVSVEESNQPVIIISQAAEELGESSGSTLVDNEIVAPTLNVVETTPANSSTLSSTESTRQVKRGRPNKYIVLENGEIIKQVTPPVRENVAKRGRGRPRGRPRRVSPVEESLTPVSSIETSNDQNQCDSENLGGKPGRRKRRIEDSDDEDSDFQVSSVTDRSSTSSPGVHRLRRSVVTNKKYEDYQVEDLPVRPESVWISESNVAVADPVNVKLEKQVDGNKDISNGNVVKGKGKRGGWSRKSKTKPQDDSVSDTIESATQNEDDETTWNGEQESDMVTCGVCYSSIPRRIYLSHQRQTHNGLSWILNEGTPIDFRDTSLANQQRLANLVRDAFGLKGAKRGKGGFKKIGKFLICDKCNHRAFSAAGYLSHVWFCGVDGEERQLRMWKCEVCGRCMLPASRYSHENTHKQSADQVEESLWDTSNSNSQILDVDGRLPKRKAAQKAHSFLRDVLETGTVDEESYGYKRHNNIPKVNKVLQDTWLRQLIEHGVIKCRYAGCNFTATSSVIMQQHCDNECPMKPSEVFECLFCNIHCSTESEIVNHVAEFHPVKPPPDSDQEHSEAKAGESSSDDDEMTETPANFSNKRQARPRLVTVTSQHFYSHSHCCSLCIAYNLNFMAQFCSYRGKIPYRPVVRWMIEKYSQNCSAPILFPSLLKLNTCIVAQMDNLNDYLPETKQSIQFSSKKLLDISEVYKWQSLPMFSGCMDDGVPTLFTGGPVVAMSWCPTPLGKLCEQFLAVTCHPSMDSSPILSQVSEAPGMVQLWSMGTLSNSPDSAGTPHLILGLCHKWGTVRQLVWCPTGCWDSDIHQYGLLAAACADGTVKIFPVGKLDACKRQFTKAQVTLTLLPHSLSHRKSPCLRVAWHTGTAQDVIAGGFANGLVCLWKISGYSQLLRHSMDGVECLCPYFRFQPHCGPITALELSPLECGEPRFLFTGCITEKSMAYWDLDKQCEFSVGTYPRRSRVTSSTWMTSWPHAIVGLEDVNQGATALPIRNFTRHMMYLPQNSSTMSVDKGDWLNGIVQGTSAGEISLALIAQMIFGMDTEKNHKNKRALLSRTTRISITSSSEEESYLTYSEASKRKLMFHDIVLDSDRPWCEESKGAQSQDTMDTVASMNYPLTAVNKVAWNPSWQSFGWIAAGYQCGLVRLLFLRCKSSDLLVKDYLNKKPNVS